MNAVNDFEKDFCKLMINSVYGKTMEYLRKRIITHEIFDKDYTVIHEIKPVLILNKPIYIRCTVLDLSKCKMYDFYHNFIKKNFDAELLFTDTDSHTYEIKSEKVYEEFFKWKNLFDFSNYSKD